MSNGNVKLTQRGQRIGGLIIALIGISATVWTWYTAFFDGYFYVFASMVFPAFLIVGLGLILFPDYKTERITRGEDISGMEGLQLLTARWWAILVVALVLSFANFLFLKFFGN